MEAFSLKEQKAHEVLVEAHETETSAFIGSVDLGIGWIREARRLDAILDFEKAVRDPQNPLRIRRDLTMDYVHPNTEGYRLMAESVPLDLFLR
jgi:hypothetical protein